MERDYYSEIDDDAVEILKELRRNEYFDVATYNEERAREAAYETVDVYVDNWTTSGHKRIARVLAHSRNLDAIAGVYDTVDITRKGLGVHGALALIAGFAVAADLNEAVDARWKDFEPDPDEDDEPDEGE